MRVCEEDRDKKAEGWELKEKEFVEKLRLLEVNSKVEVDRLSEQIASSLEVQRSKEEEVSCDVFVCK